MKKFLIKIYNFFFNYPTPGNLSNVWNFGAISAALLAFQIITGIILSFYYVPADTLAFGYVESINRDSIFGWFIRYLHSNGASLFFFFVYLHFFRSLYYFNFVNPKLAVWNLGVMILLLMIITAFTGYVLPWGQMSFRAATVITNLVSVVPHIGIDLLNTIWGSYSVTSITLNRVFSIHFILPFVILLLVIMHFLFLHEKGSKNGLHLESKKDKINFNPFFTFKDILVVILVIVLFTVLVKIIPNYLGHSDNYIPADSMITPPHIIPEWYFLAFYAMLRAVPSKAGGVIILLCSILILFAFPYAIRLFYPKDYDGFNIDINKPDSIIKHNSILRRTLPALYKICFWFFVIDFIGLSYIGMQPVEEPYLFWGLIFTAGYFAFFSYIFIVFEIQETWYILKKVYRTEKESFKLYYSIFKKNFKKSDEYLVKFYNKIYELYIYIKKICNEKYKKLPVFLEKLYNFLEKIYKSIFKK